jgi:hypothetical protein
MPVGLKRNRHGYSALYPRRLVLALVAAGAIGAAGAGLVTGCTTKHALPRSPLWRLR